MIEVMKNNQWNMLDKQKDYMQHLHVKGIVTYDVEVDKDYAEEKDYTSLNPPRRRGRHRPGVMKNHQGETWKLDKSRATLCSYIDISMWFF